MIEMLRSVQVRLRHFCDNLYRLFIFEIFPDIPPILLVIVGT